LILEDAVGREKQEASMDTDLVSSLQRNFGFTTFRPGQAEAITSLKNNQHTLVVMPTGAGKSLIYQLTSLDLPGLTLEISPLIALMKNQVDALERRRIASTQINHLKFLHLHKNLLALKLFLL
jgi:ATP-dependent DNA helicase RecQ